MKPKVHYKLIEAFPSTQALWVDLHWRHLAQTLSETREHFDSLEDFHNVWNKLQI